ncbi:MAG TPA: flagellar basal body P-ring formation chaperone FlgA [Noviherbaspirillum sp.]|nr:flagellar basal body P-ring formation chaperone FlgA [Noviherbaspirillum sp.]
MRLPSRFLLAASWLVAACLGAAAAQASAPRHDPAQIRLQVEHYLRTQTNGLPGEVNITVGQVDTRIALPMCAAPEPFLPNGARLWGKTSVGVRCSAPLPWTIYVPATVQVLGEYLVAAAPLASGQTLGPNDVAKMTGDLTALPNGVVTDPSLAVGRTLTMSIAAGAPLRGDALRAPQAVQQGQTVRLVSIGPGFRVSAEGRALNNAADGQIAQARTASGQVVSGIARAGGVVEVSY